jgi:uncharacterized SAM-binding protein YcdF (DUF218 family)
VGVLRRHLVLVVGAGLLLAVASVFLAAGLAVWRSAHQDDASRVGNADIILVLGAAEYDGVPSPVFRGRLDHALLLYRQARAPVVMVLGGKRAGDVTSEAQAGTDYLIERGVPAAAALSEPVGNTTLESLRAAASYMHAHRLVSAFLVSDPWHNLRIKRMASDLGIRGYASATWTSAARSEGTRFEGYLRETLAYLHYRVFGS